MAFFLILHRELICPSRLKFLPALPPPSSDSRASLRPQPVLCLLSTCILGVGRHRFEKILARPYNLKPSRSTCHVSGDDGGDSDSQICRNCAIDDLALCVAVPRGEYISRPFPDASGCCDSACCSEWATYFQPSSRFRKTCSW